jgi:lipoate-protein ligase A
MEALQDLQLGDLSFSKDGQLDGHTNMARDAAMLDLAEQGRASCRVYRWDGPWVSLGKQQVAQRDLYDSTVAPWVSRPTGGKAVLHGHDVTVGLALPLEFIRPSGEDPHPLSRSVRKVYRFVTQPLVVALNECGLKVGLAEATEFSGSGVKSADCFSHVSPNDIVRLADGVKACGCALRLTARAVLVQASIPNGPPLVNPASVFGFKQIQTELNWDSNQFAESLEKALNSMYDDGGSNVGINGHRSSANSHSR